MKVVLNVVAAGPNVDVERDRGLDIPCKVGKQLASAVTREVPGETDTRLRVADEIIQVKVLVTPSV